MNRDGKKNVPAPDVRGMFAGFFTDGNGKYADSFPEQVLEKIREEKLFKCFLPESLGGLALGLREMLKIIEDSSYLNGSFGWLVQIGNGGNYFAACFDERVSQELFSPASAVLAGSGAPSGKAIPVDGGYRVSGEWKYCSGAAYATFFTMNCIVEGSGEMISCATMRENVEVISDWKTFGLKNTSTDSMRVKDVFVPREFVFSYMEHKSYHDVPIFRLPFLAYAQLFFMPVVFGIFQRYAEESLAYSSAQEKFWTRSHPGRTEYIAKKCRSFLRDLASFRSRLFELAEKIESSSGVQQEEFCAALDRESRTHNRALVQYAHELFPLLGMQALYLDHPLNIFYTDLLCASQHKLLNSYSTETAE
ncbi:MAG TPA: hypothetical protein VFU15_17725 [Bacteroidia bacterium]|nr:hypothetical protein [Bacteroidia bacterium]